MAKAKLDILYPCPDTIKINFSGQWQTGRQIPSRPDIEKLTQDGAIRKLQFESNGLTFWDSSVVVFVSGILKQCEPAGITVDQTGLPSGAKRLLTLASAVAPKTGADKNSDADQFLARIGDKGIQVHSSILMTFEFIGDLTLSFGRLIRGKAHFRMADVYELLQECGWKALPIVSLISILVGLILAFMGAVQLRLFDAQIYVADLVAIGMAREMAPIMTGVIISGRTGAAFAANIGTMQVNEEVDALKTLGLSPIDYLVLPRVLVLVLMMPLLCLYSDLLGLAGGMAVGIGMMDIPYIQYLEHTRQAVDITDFSIGLVKSVLFGFIVALSGCLQGMYCGRSASAVGLATTSAVVIAIVYIVVADGLFAVITNMIGI
ncbi:MAG: ABC transporter permease [Desulfobacteraceae bacterium]|nr:ABC transporter permease [Desulfobacteraceae bacterium]